MRLTQTLPKYYNVVLVHLDGATVGLISPMGELVQRDVPVIRMTNSMKANMVKCYHSMQNTMRKDLGHL